ncbi:Na+/H+ antiporter NhaA [Phaeacidiphilus oryzae]|uniref:Na+/H+ antiporter NhaA n=1 Tax=Phaeacidiphilus oryzae TaxID=348818 RepID=UPI00068C6303|nr:Na+/H+ antiporter NhaA [Phaeacidiphilus oryzae]
MRRTPLREFMRTETGSAAVLLAGVVVALLWANLGPGGYEEFWSTRFSLSLGSHGIRLELREWVNSGLMALFFFVVGLEARREFDMGELRERKRVALPVLSGLCGMVVPIVLYLAVTAGHGDATRGWGAAMSTDTAFALGLLALLGRRLPSALRTYVLTVAVVDDLVALIVIAVAYGGRVSTAGLCAAVGLFLLALLMRALRVRRGPVYGAIGVALWVALLESGVDPVVGGLAMGLISYAAPASREDLERATDLFRDFREQPTPEYERNLRQGLRSALSPNDRLQQLFHPWTSYLIVPLFALANAGIQLSGSQLSSAFGSPVTLGIIAGYVLGKPVGIVGTAAVTGWLSRGRLRPPVGWGAVTAGGTIAGIGFTVSLLIATLAFHGRLLDEAKIGILTAVLCSFLLTWAVTAVIGALPRRLRTHALLGTDEGVTDLAIDVDPAHDHVRGPAGSLVTLVEYGDFECTYCGQAEPVVRQLLAGYGDIRYVWRHLPLTDVHPHAQLAAEGAEAAADQGEFWRMHDLLLNHQGALGGRDLVGYAERLGLDTERFRRRLIEHADAQRVAEDVESADLSGVSGTPTFFVNGRRHEGAYDITGLTEAIAAARSRAALRRKANRAGGEARLFAKGVTRRR